MNRVGNYQDAGQALRRVAARISGYAGSDTDLQRSRAPDGKTCRKSWATAESRSRGVSLPLRPLAPRVLVKWALGPRTRHSSVVV